MKRSPRIYYELWLIIILVSLGFTNTISMGFYRSRLIDLLFIISTSYLFINFFKREVRINKKLLIILIINISYLVIRLNSGGIFSNNMVDISTLKSSFGMSIIYCTPIIYMLLRETRVTKKLINNIINFSLLYCLLSQLGLLSLGESSVAGAVNLGSIIGIESRAVALDFPERTNVIWRAISVGYTLSLILVKNNLNLKLFGLFLFILQFGGGGGGRSSLIFLFFTPLIIFWWSHKAKRIIFFKKLVPFLMVSFIFGFIYMNAPAGGSVGLETKDERVHQERISEIFTIFSSSNMDTGNKNLFSGRLYIMAEYMYQILSDPKILLFGTGFSFGNAFDVYDIHGNMVNAGLAHNVFIDTWGLSGIIGVLFLCFFFYYIYDDMKQLVYSSRYFNYKQKVIAYTYVIAMLYFFQYLMVQAVAADRSFMIVFFFAAGLLKPIKIYLENTINNKFSLVR